jgi:hypothetical protein
MATVSGFGTGFNAAQFRSAIKNVMKMGAPSDLNERVTFVWTPRKSFTVSDSNNKAWTKETTPSTTYTHANVQIDCAVDFIPSRMNTGTGQTMGEFDVPHAVITVLDEDYPSIFDGAIRADKVLMGGDTYIIDYVSPPMGLFAVTVYQIHVSAVDEV